MLDIKMGKCKLKADFKPQQEVKVLQTLSSPLTNSGLKASQHENYSPDLQPWN
jgi:hypothetical protein